MESMFKFILLLILSLPVIWFGIDHYSKWQLNQVCADWPRINRSLAGKSEAFPETKENESTAFLRQYYARLYLPEDLETIVSEYLDTQFERSNGKVTPPELSLSRILEQNKKALAEIVFFLANQPLPIWSYNPNTDLQDEIENVRWVMDINRLLVAQSLHLATQGKVELAWPYLHASALLAESLFRNPMLLSQMYATVFTELRLLAMRKMDSSVPDWVTGPNPDGLQFFFLLAISAEARWMLNMIEQDNLLDSLISVNEMLQEFGITPSELGIVTRLYCSPFGRPYRRLFVAGHLHKIKVMIQAIEDAGPCNPEPIPPIQDNLLPNWLLAVADSVMKPVFSIAEGAEDSEEDSMLRTYTPFLNKKLQMIISWQGTEMILAAKEARAKSSERAWPETVNVAESGCLYNDWRYQVREDGTVDIEYQGPYGEDSTGRMRYAE